MIRLSLVSGFLTILTLSSVHVPIATADPIIASAHRRVYGYTYVDGNYSPTQHVYSNATSGPFVANIADAQATIDASAAFEADLDSALSPYLMEGTGSAFATTDVLTPGAYPFAYGDAYFVANFILDGNYNYDFSGFISASASPSVGYGDAYATLYSFDTGYIHYTYTTDGLIPFSYSGTLGAGQYQLFLFARAYHDYDGLANADFDAALSLTPLGVPDTGDTAMLLLLASALLGAFALQQRRQVS